MAGILRIALCCLLIGLAANVVSVPYNSPNAKPKHRLSFADLLRKEVGKVGSIVNSVTNVATETAANIMSTIPIATNTVNNAAKDVDSIFNKVGNAVQEISNKISNNEMFGDLQRKIQYITKCYPEDLKKEIDQIIANKKMSLIEIILDSNFTNNAQLKIELLDAIANSPETKKDLDTLVTKTLSNVIYEKYLEISDSLKSEIKEEVDKMLQDIDKYVSIKIERKREETEKIDDFIIKAADDVSVDVIGDEIDKIFDDENERIKKRVEEVINKIFDRYI